MLASTERLDIPFAVESPGLIIVVAATGAWRADGQLLPLPRKDERARHKLELIPPGDGAQALERTVETPESNVVHEVPRSGFTPGTWTARLTNLGTNPQDFGLYVSYPGSRELHHVDLPIEVFDELASLRLAFGRGEKASSLEIETAAGPLAHYFTLPEMEYSCPWTPRVVAYFEHLESTSLRVSVPAGTPDPLLRFELGFSDHGVEVNGTIPLDLRNMALTLDLPIIVQYHRATGSRTLASIEYDEADIRVSFTFDPKFDELTEWFPGFFPRWRRLIQRTVETACRQLLSTPELREIFSNSMHARVLAHIGEHGKPVGVAAADGKLRFSYYTI
jgi:hypothetical protein